MLASLENPGQFAGGRHPFENAIGSVPHEITFAELCSSLAILPLSIACVGFSPPFRTTLSGGTLVNRTVRE
jgi:hypothetical protein